MEEKVKTKPNLSLLALASFIVSLIIARTFTSLYPKIVWEVSGYHIHHFWYGLAMLTISGWLGISVENERFNRVASILFGAGGGLIADEVGLLLTLESEGYWAETTYTLLIMFLALILTATLIVKYSKTLRVEFPQFFGSNISLYLGVFSSRSLNSLHPRNRRHNDDRRFKRCGISGVSYDFSLFCSKGFVKNLRDTFQVLT
ncbi:MAG: hypothetical protein QXZ02_04650 [Candidatus Bathyarchaeia archaeon]